MQEKKLFLLDAMALVYRAYYALIRSPRVTTTGINTNAQFGFTNTLIELIYKEKPTHMAVVFDTNAETERHTDFREYKANRQETPEDLQHALPDIKEIIRGFHIPCMELDGYEADDIIGTLAWQAAAKDYTVYMVTPDKDYGQLVKENIYIYKPAYQGGNVEIYGPKEICDRWNIREVSQVIDILGLMGDAVDNIPGIPGVGEKTAVKLLAAYGTLEGVLEHADEIKGALGEKVRKGKESAVLSKKLATIITHVPVDFHEEEFRLKEWNKEALAAIFNKLEFKTLGRRILGEDLVAARPAAVAVDLFGNPIHQKEAFPARQAVKAVPEDLLPEENTEMTATISDTPHSYHLIADEEQLAALMHTLEQAQEIAFDTETTHIDANLAELVGMSFCIVPGEAYYLPVPESRADALRLLEKFKPLFENPSLRWIGQNIKYDLIVLRWYGHTLKGSLYDTMLAHYVAEPEGKRNMDAMSVKYLEYQPIAIEALIGKGKNQRNMRDVPVEEVKEYAAEDADVTLRLKHKLAPLVREKEVEPVLHTIENPLVPVLVDMEFEGVGIDVAFLKQYAAILDADIKEAEKNVFMQAGLPFNLSSPKQLGEVLFDRMQLDPSAKKTKTGQYATGEEVLIKLRKKHQIVDDILVYRELTKLKSTYVDALPQMIHPVTGRVHTCFNQAVAVTGRLSSTNPNLQNIPIRTERGREIRKAFIPRKNGWVLLSADYSQIELRIIAALSGDESMIQAFRDHKDIHTATAAKVYGIDEEAVSPEMRRAAKAVNFGIIYGQSAFGLSENLGISRTEAKQIIEQYFQQYPAIKEYMDVQIRMAQEKGYVQTLLGRKRWLRDINSSNATVRGYAERNAINMPVQGTAADMIKLAMIRVYHGLQKEKMETRMILQVHDELVFDVPEVELEKVKSLIINEMQEALALPYQVPVIAEAGEGQNWLEAH